MKRGVAESLENESDGCLHTRLSRQLTGDSKESAGLGLAAHCELLSVAL